MIIKVLQGKLHFKNRTKRLFLLGIDQTIRRNNIDHLKKTFLYTSFDSNTFLQVNEGFWIGCIVDTFSEQVASSFQYHFELIAYRCWRGMSIDSGRCEKALLDIF